LRVVSGTIARGGDNVRVAAAGIERGYMSASCPAELEVPMGFRLRRSRHTHGHVEGAPLARADRRDKTDAARNPARASVR